MNCCGYKTDVACPNGEQCKRISHSDNHEMNGWRRNMASERGMWERKTSNVVLIRGKNKSKITLVFVVVVVVRNAASRDGVLFCWRFEVIF